MSFEVLCPACGGPLGGFSCCACGRVYEVIDGIPVMLAGRTELMARQAAFFDDQVDVEFEIERPRGMPRLYNWYYAEKFRRGTSSLRPSNGATALAVCGGSGMDAEFLASAGWRVTSVDISLGASRRARDRARRHGFELTVVVGDAEQLPFGDASFDLVYVHDGLHHLADPERALREIARVAKTAVSVNEPARAAVTAAAVRLGLALRMEEAGNEVARLDLDHVESVLRDAAFDIAARTRYAMYFRHDPGRLIRWLSRPVPFAITRAALWIADKVIGRFGNKLAVQAIRADAATPAIGRAAA